jgi:hypothetical protein
MTVAYKLSDATVGGAGGRRSGPGHRTLEGAAQRNRSLLIDLFMSSRRYESNIEWLRAVQENHLVAHAMA